MKRGLIYIGVICALLTSCSQSEMTETAYGNVALSIEQGENINVEIEGVTRATQVISDSYQINTENAEGTALSTGTGTYGNLKGGFIAPEGSGYKMSAYNVTEAASEASNNGFGEARYWGSTTFDVTAYETTPVSFVCTMVNAQVSVAYDETFTQQFSNYSVELAAAANADRTVEFTSAATTSSPLGFFTVDETNPTLHIKIKGTRRLDSTYKEFSQTIQLSAKYWHKLTVKTTTVSGGVGVEVTVDNALTESSTDVAIDPYA